MQRLLPPLLVAVLVVGLVASVLARPSRMPRQQQISSLVFGGNVPEAVRELERYQDDFDGAEDRWFAAEMLLRLGRIDEGVQAIWGNPDLADDPATPRRFGILGLTILAWRDKARIEQNADTARLLVTLVEGRVPWAEDKLRARASRDDLISATRYFFPAFRNAASHPLRLITEGFRKRRDPQFDVAAAMGAVREGNTASARDIKALRRVVAAERWRNQHTDVWRASCFALGLSGDEAGRQTLRDRLAELLDTGGITAPDDVAFVRLGLFAGGDWSQHPVLFRSVLEPDRYRPDVAEWAAAALLHLHHSGDKEARHILGDVWSLPGSRFLHLRHRIARSLLLGEAKPDEEVVPLSFVLSTLQAEGAPPVSHMIARAYLYRRGQANGRDLLIEALRETGRLTQIEGSDPTIVREAVQEGLRALLLFGPSTQP